MTTTTVDPLPPTSTAPTRPRAARHVVPTVVSLVLTPVGMALFIAAARAATPDILMMLKPTPLQVLGMLAGALVLGAVAVTARWSSVGPVVAGTIFGVVPGLGLLLAPVEPQPIAGELAGTHGQWAAASFGSSGVLLLVGVLLVSQGVAAALARRARHA